MRIYAVDFETYWEPKGYSLKKMPMYEYIKDDRFKALLLAVQDVSTGKTVLFREGDITPENLSFLNGSAIVAHNVQFDGAILHWHYGIKASRWWCTAAMSRALFPGQKHSLSEVARRLLGTDKLADLAKDELTQEEFEAYCRRDVELCASLFRTMLGRYDFPKEELDIIHIVSRMYIEPTLELDPEVLEEELREQQKVKALHTTMLGLSEETLRKRDKVLAALKALGVPPPVDPKTGKETLDKKNPVIVDVLLGKYGKEAKLLMQGRLVAASSIAETRTRRLLDVHRLFVGRLPVPLLYYGAHTGRSSGGDKLNLQNLPRGSRLRKAITAPKGHKLVVADSSQIEARTLAWWAGQEDLLQAFRENKDVYSQFASIAFNKPVDKKSDPVARFIGKTCVLGLGYGMSGKKLLLTLKAAALSLDEQAREFISRLGEAEAQQLVDTYRRTYGRINRMYAIIGRIIERGEPPSTYIHPVTIDSTPTEITVRLPNGLSIVQSREKNLWYGLLIENVIQALARIVVFEQARVLDKMGFRVVHFVHDEIVLCVPDAQVDEAVQAVQKVMRTPPDWAEGLPLDMEYAVGERYEKP